MVLNYHVVRYFGKKLENGIWYEISILGLDTLQWYDYFGGSVGIYTNFTIVGAYGGNDLKNNITNE